MKTAMQELAMIIEDEQGMVLISKFLEKEKQQIIDAFDKGKSRAYATSNGECEVKFGFQFYNETYTENEHK